MQGKLQERSDSFTLRSTQDLSKETASFGSELRASLQDAVALIFEQNPRLSQVGSKEQYLEYLATVFPDSFSKDIFYHSSDAQFRDEGFKPTKPNFDTLNSIEGVYNFSSNLEFTRRYGANVYAVLLDIRKPLSESCSGEYHDHMDGLLSEALIKIGLVKSQAGGHSCQPELKDTDAFINNISGEYYIEKHPRSGKEYGIPKQQIVSVFNPEKIHILGSNKDLHKFQEFINQLEAKQ